MGGEKVVGERQRERERVTDASYFILSESERTYNNTPTQCYPKDTYNVELYPAFSLMFLLSV